MKRGWRTLWTTLGAGVPKAPDAKPRKEALAHIARLLERVGCRLLALPAYSPDLNKVESLWNRIKQHIKLRSDSNLSFREQVDKAFCSL